MAESPESDPELRRILDVHSVQWMSLPGVQAVGCGENCIKVYFLDQISLRATAIPDEIENINIVKVVSDQFITQ